MRRKEDWTIMTRNYSSERSMYKNFLQGDSLKSEIEGVFQEKWIQNNAWQKPFFKTT